MNLLLVCTFILLSSACCKECNLMQSAQLCLEPMESFMSTYSDHESHSPDQHLLIMNVHDICHRFNSAVACIDAASAACGDYIHLNDKNTIEHFLNLLSSEGVLSFCYERDLTDAYRDHAGCVIEHISKGRVCLDAARDKYHSMAFFSQPGKPVYNSRSQYCKLIRHLMLCLDDLLGPFCGRKGVHLFLRIMVDFLPSGNFEMCTANGFEQPKTNYKKVTNNQLRSRAAHITSMSPKSSIIFRYVYLTVMIMFSLASNPYCELI